MRIVGIDFRDGILFVPEVLLAANAMKAGMAILRPLLAETGAEPIGKVVIGTVKGDIHDIGKNLVGMMLEGAGFEVFDLGINTDADKFLAALEEHQPDILGMSALLTTTMPYMKVVIQTLKDRGIARRLHRARRRRTAQRGVRAWRSAPTPTAATPASPPRRPRRLIDERRARVPGAEPRPSRRSSSRCGALAARAASALTPADLARRVEVVCLAARPAQLRPDAHRRRGLGPHRRDPRDLRPGRPRSSSPTPTAARVARSTRCSSAKASSGSPGAHCYEFFAGSAAFAAMHDEELGTFYLTDFLARHFDALVWPGLGLDRHPELRADVLRQLPARRLPRADRRPGADARRPRPPRPASGSRSSIARRATAS